MVGGVTFLFTALEVNPGHPIAYCSAIMTLLPDHHHPPPPPPPPPGRWLGEGKYIREGMERVKLCVAPCSDL